MFTDSRTLCVRMLIFIWWFLIMEMAVMPREYSICSVRYKRCTSKDVNVIKKLQHLFSALNRAKTEGCSITIYQIPCWSKDATTDYLKTNLSSFLFFLHRTDYSKSCADRRFISNRCSTKYIMTKVRFCWFEFTE